MRMQEDGSYVRIYSAEGELIGTVADDDSYAVQGAGALGQGKDGKVYAAAQAVGNTTAGDLFRWLEVRMLFAVLIRSTRGKWWQQV